MKLFDFTTLKSLTEIYPLFVRKFENFNPPDVNATVTEKINAMIQYLNEMGRLNTAVVTDWNAVMKWVEDEGITETIDAMLTNGDFDTALNTQAVTYLNTRVAEYQSWMDNSEVSFNTWFQNLKNILTASVAGNLQNEIDDITSKISWINPDQFTGTDAQKLQHAINQQIIDKTSSIILNRIYDITGSTIYIDKDFTTEDFTNIYGFSSGGLRKNDSGFMFDSHSPLAGSTIQSGNVRFIGLEFKSVSGVGMKIFNGDALYQVYSAFNRYKDIDCIVYQRTNYLQSFHFFECHVYGGNGIVIDYKTCFDFVWEKCSITSSKDGIICTTTQATSSNPNPSGSGNNNIRILNSVFQGMTGNAIITGFSSVAQIRGNYFELNAGYIDVSYTPSYGLEIANNFFHDTDTSKVGIYWATEKVGGRTDQDKYVSIANMARAGMQLHGFKTVPSIAVKIYSIGDVGTILNYPDSIMRIGQRDTSSTTVGSDTVNINVLNGVKYIDMMHYGTINAADLFTFNIDTGITLDNANDIIQVSLIGDGNTDTDFERFELVNTYAFGTIVKVRLKSNYAGTAGVRIYIRIIKVM